MCGFSLAITWKYGFFFNSSWNLFLLWARDKWVLFGSFSSL
jgi:hypothetical protein